MSDHIWIIIVTALCTFTVYLMGKEQGKRDAWDEADKMGERIAKKCIERGIKIVPEETLKYIEKFDAVEFPTDKRSIN